MEKRFQKDPLYFIEYKNFIDEYLSLNHGKFVPLDIKSNNSFKYFLPHHAVIREHSTTIKLRVVFDGSCSTTTKASLNDIIYKGYQVQPDLFDILARFRSYKYVLTSDIQKMFRQILVNPSQTFLLNILWRESPNEPIQCIELQTVTFGTNCAPYLATRVLYEIAQNNKTNYPLASQAILHQCYVDDILAGTDELSELENLYDELNSILNAHGFTLHKWCSNTQDFLKLISQETIDEYKISFDDNPNKVLGLIWNPILDYLSLTIPSITFSGPFTKRKILSIIAQCYDPLGLLTAVIVIGKLIVQKLWISKIDWDTEIKDESLINDWKRFIENLHLLSQLKIPRYLFSCQTIQKVEVHGFADASTQAYAACVYFRTFYMNGDISVQLVSAKSKVAPIKVVSLPRLELCAMLLLSNLVQKLLEIYR